MATSYSPYTPQGQASSVGYAPSRIPSGSTRKASLTTSSASPGSTSVSSNGSSSTSGTGIPTFRSLRSLLPFGPNKQPTPISASVSPSGPSPHSASHGSGIKSPFATFGTVRRSINIQRERKTSISTPSSNKQAAASRDGNEVPVISIGHGGEQQQEVGTPIRKSLSLTAFDKSSPVDLSRRVSNDDTIGMPSPELRSRSVDARRDVKAAPISQRTEDYFGPQPPTLPVPPSTSPINLPIDLSTIIEADSSGISKHLPSASTSAADSSSSLPASRFPSTSPSASPSTKLQPPPSIPSTPLSLHSPAFSDATENESSQLDLSTTHLQVQVLDAIERAGRRASGGMAGVTAGDWLKDASARIVDADADPDASFVVDEESVAIHTHPILDDNEVEDQDISFDLDADAIDPALAALLSPNKFPSSSTSATIIAPTPTVARSKSASAATGPKSSPVSSPTLKLQPSTSPTQAPDIVLPTLLSKRPYQSSLPRLRTVGQAAPTASSSSTSVLGTSISTAALTATASSSGTSIPGTGTSANTKLLESPTKISSPQPSPTLSSTSSSAYTAGIRRATPGTAPVSPLASAFVPPTSASSSEASSSKKSLSISLGRRTGQVVGTSTGTGTTSRLQRPEHTRMVTSPGSSPSISGNLSTAAGLSPSRLDPAIILQNQRPKTSPRVGHGEGGDELGLGRPSGSAGVVSSGRRPSGEYDRSSSGLSGKNNSFIIARQRRRSMSMEERGLMSSMVGRSMYTGRMVSRMRDGGVGSGDVHVRERDEGSGSRPGSSLSGRPPMTEWIGPRTAKAFRAAGLLDNSNSTSGGDVGSISGHLGRFGSLRSTAMGSGSGTASEYGGSSVSTGRGYGRAASRLAFSEAGGPISAPITGGLNRNTSRSGSVSYVYPQQQSPTMESPTFTLSSRDRETPTRSASTAPTSVSGYSHRDRDWDGEPHRDLARDRERERDREELSNMKEKHHTETAALLAALSDSQRTSRVLREENAELRDRLVEAEGDLNRLGAEVENLREALEGEIEKTVKLEEQLADSKDLVEENGRLKKLVGELRVQVRLKSLGLSERSTGRSGADMMTASLGRYTGQQRMVPSSLSRSASASPSFDVEGENDGGAFLADGPTDQNMPAGGGKNPRIFATTSTSAALRTLAQPQGRLFPTEQRIFGNHSRRPSASSSSSVFPSLPPNMTMLMHEDSVGYGSGASGSGGSPRQFDSGPASPSYSLAQDDDEGNFSGLPSSPTIALPLRVPGAGGHKFNTSISSTHRSLSPTTPSFSMTTGSPESLLFLKPEHERHLGDLESLDLGLPGQDEEEVANAENILDI